MASLRDTVKDYQKELRDGIAWVAFWKTGRSWNAVDFLLKLGDYLYQNLWQKRGRGVQNDETGTGSVRAALGTGGYTWQVYGTP